MSLSGFVAPVSGPAGSGFRTADRPRHEGIDFPIPSGSPVYAARAGTIRRTGIDSGGYGNFIEIDHGGGTTTRYGHLREFLVTSGRVNAGQIIAYSGGGANDPQPGRGRSTGAHLHFELRINGNPVDPSQYLPAATGRVAPTPVSMGEIFGRMLIPNLPAGYRVEGRDTPTKSYSVIVTPNGTSFPRYVTSARDISNFSSLSRESQNQITEYFRIVNSR